MMEDKMAAIDRRPSRWPALLLAAYSLVVLFGTLMPFHFTARPEFHTAKAKKRIELVPFTHICPTHGFFCPMDFGVNIAMLAPIGALIVLLPGATRGRWSRVRRATLICLAASTAIEVVQLFLPSRSPSTSDVILNTLGGFLAASITSIAVRLAQRAKSPG
jgi:glycopeptide antibiotics resistance protein